MDLSQAEAVADIIHADSAAAHQTAMNQLRGGISKELKVLRQELLDFAGLLELELDFSEEDVEFANRDKLTNLMRQILAVILQLAGTFKAGNAIKNGIAVVIAGKPNAGKSTLLNALLQEERAIVSEIAGTTRDVIEDELLIEGIRFRFIDTAGLRATTDTIEAIGVARSKEQMGKADVILYLFDASITTPEELAEEVGEWEELGKPIVLIANKYDLGTAGTYPEGTQFISAKNKDGIEPLKQLLLQKTIDQSVAADGVMITNIRHHEALQASGIALQKALQHIETQIGTELIAEEIREALYQLGLITGEVNNEELLGTIFSRFCIGK
jgi:tRNA modification GTPase